MTHSAPYTGSGPEASSSTVFLVLFRPPGAPKSWDTGADFRGLVSADPDIRRALSEKEIHAAFDLQRQLRNVDAVFKRVFG